MPHDTTGKRVFSDAINTELAKRITLRMNADGLSTSQVAHRGDVHEEYFVRFLNGSHVYSFGTATMLAYIVGLTLADIEECLKGIPAFPEHAPGPGDEPSATNVVGIKDAVAGA